MFLSKGKFGIKIVLLGHVDTNLKQALEEYIQKEFRKKVYILEYKLPLTAFDFKRKQYNAEELMEITYSLKSYKEKIMGLICEDIFIDNEEYILSLTDTKRETLVLSTYRLSHSLQESFDDPLLLANRLAKLIKHNLWRIQGLEQCSDPKCVMFDSPRLEQLDQKDIDMCPQCKKKVY